MAIEGAIEPDLTLNPTAAELGCQFRCALSLPGLTRRSTPAQLRLVTGMLNISRAGAGARLWWTGTGRLQEAETPAGPWAETPGVVGNQLLLPATSGPRFYRLINP